jgi:hypothetical protein
MDLVHWLGANATMAAWLYEQNGQRLGRAMIVNIVNATMCAVTVALILVHRSSHDQEFSATATDSWAGPPRR